MEPFLTSTTLRWVAIAAFVISTGCSSNSDSGIQPSNANDAAHAPGSSADSGRRVPPGADTGDGCGGFLGDTCSAEEYCAYQPGEYCGAADASSTCKPRPSVCTKEYNPVCGCDNKTYGNACEANAAGFGLLSLGECAASN